MLDILNLDKYKKNMDIQNKIVKRSQRSRTKKMKKLLTG